MGKTWGDVKRTLVFQKNHGRSEEKLESKMAAEENNSVPACDTISHHVIPTERAGALNVWVQGDLGLAQNKDTRDSVCVFMTVHDVGANHHSWLKYANSPAMAEIRENPCFCTLIYLDKKMVLR